jgi:Predicted membrane protein (DUF2207)
MTIGADLGVLAAAGDGLVERWRDLGPTLWLIAGVLAAAWLAMLALLAAVRDPRKVRPGPAVLELQGTESPAVVNLLTTDWDLGHEAVAATLVDLAAKRRVEIGMVGDDTFVRVRRRAAGNGGSLTGYEGMVLDHVAGLASHTEEGRVPARALTTGPEQSAKRWWRNFRSSVVDESRSRGLSRPRWPAGLKAVMIAAAVPVALAVALAASTARDDPDDPDDNPVEGAFAAGIITLAGAGALVGSRSGERDTPEGREAAARWLGLREVLEEDPLFAEQPPAAVAIWDHLLAHGTALGVAHGVVAALPMGTESDTEAWSPFGGRWRVVRVRYPRWFPPGYGLHPGLAVLFGLLHLLLAATLLPVATGVAGPLLDRVREGGLTSDGVPDEVDLLFEGFALLIVVVAAAIVLQGVTMLVAGMADLVLGRGTVEGRVLRVRDRVKRDEDGRVTSVTRHVAVDDGTTDRVRAWRFRSLVPGPQGATVRGRVSRFLRHVADYEEVGRHPTAAPEAAPAGATTTGPDGPTAPPATVPVPQAPRTLAGAALAFGNALGDQGNGGRAPAPPLPDDAAVSAAAGQALARDAAAKPHPAALAGGSALYRTGGRGHVQVVWVPAAAIDVYRRLPAALRHELPGLGDEAYRARFGGGVMARRGDHVVMVTPHLPSVDIGLRDDIAARVALAALDCVRPGRPVSAFDLDDQHDA